MPDPTACRSCGQPVRWLRNIYSGTLAPIDAEPDPNGNIARVRVLEYRVVGNSEPYDGDRYLSHFVTCPQGESWRQPRRKDKAPKEGKR